MKIVAEILLGIMAVWVGMSILYLHFGIGKRLFHDKLKWHEPTDEIGYDGVSYKSTCKYCGKKILMDSQGNWFDCDVK